MHMYYFSLDCFYFLYGFFLNFPLYDFLILYFHELVVGLCWLFLCLALHCLYFIF